ncbi:hypothetical protein SK128_022763 [Halocaridina rubra]|uniref:MICOS complex subunit MIC13 n=1 Tax=Halocaridina rubra TaxID=373956 RepID=A0AAN9AGX0_HALRR
MKKVLKLAWFATKVGIGGGVVYFTVDQGVWGDSRQAAATYDRLYDIMPGTKNVSLKYLTLPKTDDVNINFRSYWNSGVFFVFDFLANLPSKMIGLKDSAVGLVSSATSSKSDESTPTTEESNPAVESETSVTETSAAPESTPPLEEKAE